MTTDKEMFFRILKYSFIFTIATSLMFILVWALAFYTLFEVVDTEAVQTGGPGAENVSIIPGELIVESGCIYLKPTTTPPLGRHPGHAVIYTKSDKKLYYLFDDGGEVEKEIKLLNIP